MSATDSTPSTLPRLTVCLSFDWDTMSLWIGSDNATAVSRGEFGAHAIPRILALLAKHDIAATFFIPGFSAITFPDLTRQIRDAGHEIGHHGHFHESPARLSEDEERSVLLQGLEALDDVAGVRPVGWRSPAWYTSDRSTRLLLEHDFTYDSSMMAADFELYRVRIGDRWAKGEPFVFGEPSELVEVPVYWGLDDFPYFEYIPPKGGGLNPASAAREVWQGDFDWAHANQPGGVFTLTMHPQVIGRGHRMAMLEGFIEHMAAQEGVVFSTIADHVETWKAAQS